MAFVPRIFEEIRDDMINFVRLQTSITDFEVGSVIRTIIEAAALEDDEQYFQMVQLLDAFRLSTATGSNLDDRVEEFGVVRLQPSSSAGDVVIQDGTLITTLLSFNIASGASSAIFDNTTTFPTSGFPYTVRLGETTINVEEASVTANDIGTNTLTFSSPTTNAHNAGDRGSIVDGAVDKPLSPGIRVQVPSSGTVPAVIFVTIATGTLINGNFESTDIDTRAEVPGTEGNIGVGKILEFTASPPFDGAAVANKKNFAGGRDIETDAQLRDRARASIQALSKGTVLALREGVIGVEDPVTGQRVTTANILESFVTDEVTVYVDDGTGFLPDQVQLSRDTLTAAVAGPVSSLVVADASEFPEEGTVLVSPEDPDQIEIIGFSGVDQGTNTISLVSVTTNLHDLGDEVALVDVIEESAETGQNFFQLGNFPVVENSFRMWVQSGGTGAPAIQTEGTDFRLSRGTGQIEFIGSGVAVNSVVIASYTYYTALLATVQKVIDGDPEDETNFPGLRAAGINVIADTPVIRRISVRLSVVAIPGVQEQTIIPQIQETIEAYINGLGIGEDVIVSEIIERAMRISGMLDVVVSTPTSNIIILENELPRPFDVSGNSLVVVV